VTFLFTDVEGSTQRWRADEAAMSAAMQAHDDTLRSVVADAGGVVFKHTGDGVIAAFGSPSAAVEAAVAAQDRLELPVRMGVHTGEAELRDGDYFGTTLNTAARIMDAGHGSQVLVSSATAALVPGVELVELGTFSLKGLEAPERIHQVGEASFPELRVHRNVVGNLPGEMDAFVGRATEVVDVAELVGAHRVVTLIGVGGTGKTRLALRVADSLRWQFPDGCWLVDLAAIASADAAPLVFARGLGVEAPEAGDVVEHVASRVGRQRRLVVVDNCEHLLDAAGDLIERLVGACSDLHVLATSREPVMVQGERLSAVPSLASEDAFGLFLERATAEAPGLELDEAQLVAAAELCERLDRLPLAIELAATRLRAQTPVELLSSVEERFRMLVGGRRSRVERHQTMRATLDWSYELCDPAEQQLFDRLSVFAAGFDLDAAAQVAAPEAGSGVDVADVVVGLVDRSLLTRVQGADGMSRFRLLETMRAYGREHLQHAGIHDDVRARHARWVDTALRRSFRSWHETSSADVESQVLALLADAAAAVDWHIDRHDWATASVLANRARPADARVANELLDRVWRAARDADQLDRLPVTIYPLNMLAFERGEIDPDELIERLLAEIRDGSWRGPAKRHFPLPQTVLGMPISRKLTPAEAHMVLQSLGELEDRTPLTRFYAYQNSVKFLAKVLDDIGPVLDELDRLAAAIGGPLALGLAQHTRCFVANSAGDLNTSLNHAQQALEQLPRSHPQTIQLQFRALADRVALGFEIRADDIREPWQQMRDIGVYAQVYAGALSTALALVRLEHPDAARDFVSWAKHPTWFARHIEESTFDQVISELLPEAAQLWAATEPTPPPSNDHIIDTALAVCDQLDSDE
jgi:predicted ATPase